MRHIDKLEILKQYPAWLFSALLLFFSVPSFSHAFSVQARLAPETFSTTQPARLTIIVTDTQSAEVTLPDVTGLAFHERGTNRQFQMINGKSSSSVTYTYLVQGLAAGSYTIPPITVAVSGTKAETEPISCTVGNSSPRSSSPQAASPSASTGNRADSGAIAFLKLIPEKTKGYVGEVIPARVEAYFNQHARARITSLPSLQGDGVLVDPISGDPEQRMATIKGTAYNVVTWNTALTGIKEGSHHLEMELNGTIQVRSKHQRRLPPGLNDDLFNDRFFNNFFDQYETQPIRVTGPPVTMRIDDLPAEGKPENFSGAVGQFTFNLDVSPKTIGPGDPITLKMSIKGTGNFDNVTAPSLTSEDGLKSYSPSTEFIEVAGPHHGEKIFEQALVVNDPGLSLIPPVAFSYFDPETKHYQTLFSDPVPITLRASPPPVAPSSMLPPATGQETETAIAGQARFPTLAPVRLTAESMFPGIRPLFMQPLYLGAAGVILVAILFVTVLRIRNSHLRRHPELTRRKRISEKQEAILKQLQEREKFHDQAELLNIQNAIRHLLGLLWQTEAASLTTADIALRLGADDPVTRIFTLADRSSYGASIFPKENELLLNETIAQRIRELS